MPPAVRTRIARCLLIVILAASTRLPAVGAAPSARSTHAASPAGDAPVGALLVENVGQFDPRVRFALISGRATLRLTEDALWLTALAAPGEDPGAARPVAPREGVHLKLTFEGANPTPPLEPFGRRDTRVSYLRGGASPTYADAPAWRGVRYRDLYPGVDLEVTVTAGGWGWRLVPRSLAGVALLQGDAGSPVRLRVEGADDARLEGARALLGTRQGDLALPLLAVESVDSIAAEVRHLPDGAITLTQPLAPRRASPDEAHAALTAGAADLLYSTFLGGSGADTGRDIAVDSAGAAYITGETWSTDFPVTPGAFDVTPSAPEVDSDAFVVKLAPDGRGVTYATFLGGAGHDLSYAIALDAAGNAYITGETQSSDFCTTPGALDTTYSTVGWSDAFVVKLNATGTALAYATYLGGSDTDIGYGIAVDATGAAYVAGYTGYTDPGMAGYESFPTTAGAYDETHNGSVGDTDAFVVKLNPSGTALAYGTLFGAGERDEAYDLALDAAGCAYVTGMTQSSDLPVTLGVAGPLHSGDDDAFALKLSTDGASLEYATYLGGMDSDWGYGIAVDGLRSAYITGFTLSTDVATTAGTFDATHNGEYDAFVFKLTADGSALAYGTYLGGSLADKGRSIAVDEHGCAYVAGETYSTDLAVVPGAYDTTANGQKDAFVAKLNATGTGLAYGAYLGGLDEDAAHGIAVGAPGYAHIAGETSSYNYPTTSGAADIGYNFGERDAVASRLAMPGGVQPTTTPTALPTSTVTVGPSPTVTPTVEVEQSPTPTEALPSPTPSESAGGYPAPGVTPTPTPRPSPAPDPRFWARCYTPMIVRP